MKLPVQNKGYISFLTFSIFQGLPLKAAVSCRKGGVSRPPFTSLNMGLHVGDRVEDVLENRSGTAGSWVWMKGCLSTAGRYMVLISRRFQKRTGAVALFPLIRLFPIRTVSLLLLLMCRLP